VGCSCMNSGGGPWLDRAVGDLFEYDGVISDGQLRSAGEGAGACDQLARARGPRTRSERLRFGAQGKLPHRPAGEAGLIDIAPHERTPGGRGRRDCGVYCSKNIAEA